MFCQTSQREIEDLKGKDGLSVLFASVDSFSVEFAGKNIDYFPEKYRLFWEE